MKNLTKLFFIFFLINLKPSDLLKNLVNKKEISKFTKFRQFFYLTKKEKEENKKEEELELNFKNNILIKINENKIPIKVLSSSIKSPITFKNIEENLNNNPNIIYRGKKKNKNIIKVEKIIQSDQIKDNENIIYKAEKIIKSDEIVNNENIIKNENIILEIQEIQSEAEKEIEKNQIEVEKEIEKNQSEVQKEIEDNLNLNNLNLLDEEIDINKKRFDKILDIHNLTENLAQLHIIGESKKEKKDFENKIRATIHTVLQLGTIGTAIYLAVNKMK